MHRHNSCWHQNNKSYMELQDEPASPHPPVHSWVRADGRYGRPHVFQIPHLDRAVVTPWHHVVSYREHRGCHGAADKQGRKDNNNQGQLWDICLEFWWNCLKTKRGELFYFFHLSRLKHLPLCFYNAAEVTLPVTLLFSCENILTARCSVMPW